MMSYIRIILSVLGVLFFAQFEHAKAQEEWKTTAVGSGVNESASYNEATGRFTISGGGTGVQGLVDGFALTYREVLGDADITARVPVFTPGSPNATAGLMIRDSLDPMARHLTMVLTASGQVEFRSRQQIGGATDVLTANGAGVTWLRVRRFGPNFEVFYSADGVTWNYWYSPAGTISLGNRLYVGMVVSNQAASGSSSAEFVDVNVPYHGQDIGTVNVPGSGLYSSATKVYTVKGAGLDPSAKIDAFHFQYRTLPGDGELVTRVESISNTGSAARAGLMVRAGLANNAACAMIYANPSGAGGFRTRTSAAGGATAVNFTSTLPLWLKLVRKGALFEGYYSKDAVTWTLVGTKSITMTGTVAGLAVTSQSANALCTGAFSNLTFMEPWVNEDIGTVGIKGSSSYNAGAGLYQVSGAGAGVAASADAFHFLRCSLSGDGQITGRIGSLSGQPTGLRSGVVIRSDATPGSAEAALLVSPSSGLFFQTRAAASGQVTTTTLSSIQAPVWLKLMRVGSSYSGYWSNDGVSWNLVGTRSATLNTVALAGMAVSSQSNTVAASAAFDDLLAGGPDTDNDNLTDSWETATFGNLAQTWGADADGDGYSNGAEFEGNTNANDIYNGAGIVVSRTSGNLQYSDPNVFLPLPFVARVTRAAQPIANAEVHFQINPLDGYLSASLSGSPLVRDLYVNTDTNGYVSAWYRQPNKNNYWTSVGAYQGSSWTTFSCFTNSPILTPSSVPGSGNLASPTRVTLLCSTSGARLHYTLNGSVPTTSAPYVLSGESVLISSSSTLNVKGFSSDPAWRPSALYSAQFTLTGSVFASNQTSAAIRTDGTLFAWGNNSVGQLGLGNLQNQLLPTQVNGVANVVAVAGGASHYLALTSAGEVWAWGLNSSGQLGLGNNTNSSVPVKIPGLTNVISIACGASHSLAVKSNGTLWSWGANADGQLGTGNTTARNTPGQITSFVRATSVAAGDGHSLALEDGQVFTWGRNSSGQLGDGSTRAKSLPVRLIALVSSIAARGDYSMCVKNTGEVAAWGGNTYGQLGIGSTTGQKAPVTLTGISSVRSVSAGLHHVAAIRTDGAIYTWGRNQNGQLGLGSVTASVNSPAAVTATGGAVVQASAGYGFTLFLRADGTVAFAGLSDQGQFGNGAVETTPRSLPVTIPNFSVFPGPASAPVFNPPGGTFGSSSLNVQITSATSGAEIHYSTTGQDPTINDPLVPVSGMVTISLPGTLKARAWKSGTPPSSITSAFYDVDSDGDGLANAYEVSIGTNPTRRDSDGDGVDDNVEISNGTDPRVNGGYNDPDGDGLTNAEEAALGTNPNSNDLPNGSPGLILLHTPLE